MTNYTVTKVSKVQANGHRHLSGVYADYGVHYTRQQVVDSIDNGNTWKTSAGGYTATIRKVTYCPTGSCMTSPYITTNPDSTTLDNLENLPEGP
jgi:uncharacterized protein DUF3892